LPKRLESCPSGSKSRIHIVTEEYRPREVVILSEAKDLLLSKFVISCRMPQCLRFLQEVALHAGLPTIVIPNEVRDLQCAAVEKIDASAHFEWRSASALRKNPTLISKKHVSIEIPSHSATKSIATTTRIAARPRGQSPRFGNACCKSESRRIVITAVAPPEARY
jgi:hypothetical protein